MKPTLVISSGAGISAESGISIFRDAGGLWENYPVMDVASATGFRKAPGKPSYKGLVHTYSSYQNVAVATLAFQGGPGCSTGS